MHCPDCDDVMEYEELYGDGTFARRDNLWTMRLRHNPGALYWCPGCDTEWEWHKYPRRDMPTFRKVNSAERYEEP